MPSCPFEAQCSEFVAIWGYKSLYTPVGYAAGVKAAAVFRPRPMRFCRYQLVVGASSMCRLTGDGGFQVAGVFTIQTLLLTVDKQPSPCSC